jgi:hypothetical protein
MIALETKDPAAAPTTNRVKKETFSLRDYLHTKSNTEFEDYQSFSIANRYSLEPHIASLVCHLAGIGGAR